jgi:hypothetical protein
MSNEPVQISRRFFLLAAAATAATFAVPMVPANELVRLPSPHPYLRRKIYDMMVGFELPLDPKGRALLASDGAALIHVRRLNVAEPDLHYMGINIRGCYRWRALADEDMLLSVPTSPINIAIDYTRPELSRIPVHIDMLCLDKVDNGPPIQLIETWRIVDGVYDPPVVSFFEPDNSLKARQERERQKQEAIASSASAWSDDYDETEYWDGDEDEDKPYHESYLTKVRRYITGT